MKTFLIPLFAILASICLLLGCASTTERVLGAEKIGGKTYETVEITKTAPVPINWVVKPSVTKINREVKSRYDLVKDKTADRGFTFIWVGILMAVIGFGVCIGIKGEFFSNLGRTVAALGVLGLIAGLVMAAVATWMTWILIGILVIGGLYYMHKCKDHGVGDFVKEKWGGSKDE